MARRSGTVELHPDVHSEIPKKTLAADKATRVDNEMDNKTQ